MANCEVIRPMRLISAVAVLAVVCAACAHTGATTALRIDSSTPEAFHASWKRLNSSLTSHERSELSLAILPIALGKYKSLVDAPPSLFTTGIGPDTIREQIDGMSFAEIVDLAQKQSARLDVAQHP
jgi:hypothetical protein